MKKKLIYLFMAVFTVSSVFTACNDDDDEKDVKEKLTGTWNVESSGAMDMKWEAPDDVKITMMGTEVKVSQVPAMLTEVVSPIVTSSLKDITFTSDGKIEATYMDSKSKSWTTAKDYATYKMAGNDKILVYVDADKAFAGKEIDAASAAKIKAMLALGVPVCLNFATSAAANAPAVRFYLDTQTIKAIGGSMPELITALAGNNPLVAGMLQSFLKDLPSVLEKSTKVEVGLNCYKAN